MTPVGVRVGVIVGSTRPGRLGRQIAEWTAQRVRAATDAELDLIDLQEVALPFLDEPQDASTHVYTQPHTHAWSERVSRLDAVILVTPEYNSSFPAPLKNALDYLADEWRGKPVAVVAYGGASSGTRAVQALLPVVTSLGMLVAGALCIPFRQRLHDGMLVLTPQDEEGAGELALRLTAIAGALIAGQPGHRPAAPTRQSAPARSAAVTAPGLPGGGRA